MPFSFGLLRGCGIGFLIRRRFGKELLGFFILGTEKHLGEPMDGFHSPGCGQNLTALL